jgi:hypothetical protein
MPDPIVTGRIAIDARFPQLRGEPACARRLPRRMLRVRARFDGAGAR